MNHLDISTENNAESARLAEERFRALCDHAPVMINSFSPALECLLWNKACEKILGYSFEEISVTRNPLELFYPDDAVRAAVLNDVQIADGIFRDYRVRLKSGSCAYQKWANFRLPTQGILSIGYDVTETKLAEEQFNHLNQTLEHQIELRTSELWRTMQRTVESEERLRGVFESELIGIFIADPHGAILDANAAFLKMVGYSEQDLHTGKVRWDSMTPPEYQHLSQQIAIDLSRTGKSRPFEKEYIRKDGSRVTVYLGSALMKTGPDRAVSYALDLTEKKRIEKLINEQSARMIASSKMSALGEMAGGVAHEINNPLAIIHGKAAQLRRLALEGNLDRETVVNAMERIEATAMRISRIVKSLRTFARDAEGDPIDSTSIAKIIEDTVEFCQERFKNHSIELTIDRFDPALACACRAVQISQVLLNLLNNAHDAVENLPFKWVKISVEDLDDHIELSVIDSGAGVLPELRDKIMQPFFTTKDVGMGTGLGLSVSKGIVEAHRGTLSFDPTWKNTRFVVRLPK